MRYNSEIYLNGDPMHFRWSICTGYFGCYNRCASPNLVLGQGLHLLEVRVKYARYGEPVHIQRWAFEIE
jgi:hypothetical protein